MTPGKKRWRMSFVAVVAALFAATLDAKTLYVDPTGVDPETGTVVSSDEYDGSAEVWQGGESTVGPMKTLAAVMKKASGGDTIIALPGYYNEGVSNPEARDSTTNLMRRVIITRNVTLKSKEGPEKTFIIGEASPNPVARGCGVNAVGCVYSSGATLQGFTLTGGRTLYGQGNDYRTQDYEGGGVFSGTVVDCIISNNACGNYGGGARNSALYRCRFYDNYAYAGDSMFGAGSCRGCYFHDTDVRNTVLYGCTFGSARVSNSTLYNCIANSTAIRDYANTYYRCLYVNVKSDDVFNDGCVKISSGDIKVDVNGVVTNGLELVRDKGNDDYFSSWSSSVDFVDIAGTPRIMNGATDIGSYEHNPTGEVSLALSPYGAFTVTNMTKEVVCPAGSTTASIGPGGVLKGILNTSKSTSPTAWSFFASVEGSGTLSVFFGDAAEPLRTVTSADGRVEVTYSGSSPTGIRLVYDGEDGAAEVSQFTRDTTLAIVADDAGITVSGGYSEPGLYVVVPGETKTVTIARSATATRFVTGLNVDGVFYDFNSYLDGISFTVTGSERSSSRRIEVVYAAAPTHEWFVDPVNGSDSYSGLYTNIAFKTLAKAASIATNSGDRILAAPGVYNEGGMASPHPDDGSNRVVLAAGVLLEGYGGAAVTTIEGEISSLPGNINGCATNSMRAVYLRGSGGSGAVIKGFTITKGRTVYPYNSKDKTGRGAGVLGGLAVECVFSNNYSVAGGNAASGGGYLLRCYLGDDPTGNYSTFSGVKHIDCVIDNARPCYSVAEVYNSTFLRGNAYGNESIVYNSIFYSASPGAASDTGTKVYNSISAKDKYASSTCDERCKFNVDLDDIPFEAGTCRPLVSSLAVDAGSNCYAVVTNKAGARWTSFWLSFLGKDYAGGQRIYNDGKIDIGAGEYDWRGDFAKELAARGVSVENAGEGVTTNAVQGIDVPAGDALKMKLTLKVSGRVSFNVDAEYPAAVQVAVDGEPVEVGEGGVVSFEAEAGESVVEVSCSEGTATVSSIVLPRLGALLILR